jgi:predicted permease
MDAILQDIRFGLRTLLKTPGFTIAAVLSLALGIGANTAIFSIIDALMLKSIPVWEPNRLVALSSGRGAGIFGGVPEPTIELFSTPLWRDLRKGTTSFSDISGIFSLGLTLRPIMAGASLAEPLEARLVTGNFFNVLGLQPAAGRLFTDIVDQPAGAHPDVVISYAYWQRRFAGDPAVVGKTMRIADRLYTIIGVTPREFFGVSVGETQDAWFPLCMEKQLPPYFDFDQEKMAHSLYLMGRLKPGVTLREAAAEGQLQIRRILRNYLGSTINAADSERIDKLRVTFESGANGLSQLRRRFSAPLTVLMTLVGLVLLIACGNVANLLLARATQREKEFALRLAVGSGRTRLIRQLLTEGLLLSFSGGLLGVLVAWWGSYALVALVAGGRNGVALNVEPNISVLAFTVGLAIFTGLLFGLAPAFRGSRVDLGPALKEGRSNTGTRRRMFANNALVVGQVALSLLLLICAGLFVKSLKNLEQIDTGFDRHSVLDISPQADAAGYRENGRLVNLYRRIEERVSSIPGVVNASFAFFAFNQGMMDLDVAVEAQKVTPGHEPSIFVNIVGPSYFDVTRVPLYLGRRFTPQDTAASPKVAVLNQAAVKRFFPHRSPIGQHMRIGDKGDFQIVGVVGDVKFQDLREPRREVVYTSYAQWPQFIGNLLIRTKDDSAASSPATVQAVRREVAQIDRNLPIGEVRTLESLVTRSIQRERMIAQLSSVFGGLALLLSAIGLYGVLSYSVARRNSEIGVRMALGAPQRLVVRMVLSETLRLIGLGIVIGTPLALLLARSLEAMLYGLRPYDGFTMAAAIAILLLIGAFAGFVPARRASAVDPMVALRYE